MKTQNFKPILFSTEMVQAILAGKKTQTRRTQGLEIPNQSPSGYEYLGWDKNVTVFKSSEGKFRDCKPKFNAGEILWVRETFLELINCETKEFAAYEYKADMPEEFHKQFPHKWKPSLFMPKEAARIFLKVTNVRVERLQEISSEDAIAEGIAIDKQPMKNNDGWYYPKNYLPENTEYWGSKYFKIGEYSKSFESLWQSINAKKHPWESNPWVWVYEFKRIEKPENFLS